MDLDKKELSLLGKGLALLVSPLIFGGLGLLRLTDDIIELPLTEKIVFNIKNLYYLPQGKKVVRSEYWSELSENIYPHHQVIKSSSYKI